MKKVLITLSLLTFLVFTSCSNILLSRKATIRFATTSSRAATTQTSAEDLTNLVLTGTHNGKTITLGNWEKFSDLNGVEIEIDVGRWDFTLEANLKTKKYRDEISNKIINIGINTLGFNLQKVIISNKTTIANFGETYKTLAAEPENANKTIEIEITEPVVTQEDWTTVATSLNKVENNVYVSLKTTLGNFTRNDFKDRKSVV